MACRCATASSDRPSFSWRELGISNPSYIYVDDVLVRDFSFERDAWPPPHCLAPLASHRQGENGHSNIGLPLPQQKYRNHCGLHRSAHGMLYSLFSQETRYCSKFSLSRHGASPIIVTNILFGVQGYLVEIFPQVSIHDLLFTCKLRLQNRTLCCWLLVSLIPSASASAVPIGWSPGAERDGER